MPPPGLRARVGLGSRDEFTLVGREGARQVVEAIRRAGPGGSGEGGDWLDFGCGCGRLARYLLESGVPRTYAGVDVDAKQVRWSARHLDGRFTVMRPRPPLAFPDSSFDVVLAISIFTHLTEDEQFVWLAEIQRLLRPGGHLVATTHSETLASTHPSVREEEHRNLAHRGFLFMDAPRFNDRAAFHSRDYLVDNWSPSFTLREFVPRGFVRYQDLAVWRVPDTTPPQPPPRGR
jgi:SAM-dependent methyltransferase